MERERGGEKETCVYGRHTHQFIFFPHKYACVWPFFSKNVCVWPWMCVAYRRGVCTATNLYTQLSHFLYIHHCETTVCTSHIIFLVTTVWQLWQLLWQLCDNCVCKSHHFFFDNCVWQLCDMCAWQLCVNFFVHTVWQLCVTTVWSQLCKCTCTCALSCRHSHAWHCCPQFVTNVSQSFHTCVVWRICMTCVYVWHEVF